MPARNRPTKPPNSETRRAPRGTPAQRFAPEVGLVVPATARLETQVAANGSHIALERTSDRSDRARKNRIFCRKQRRFGNFGERGERADPQRPGIFHSNSAQRANRFDVHKGPRAEELHLQVRNHVRSTRKDHCVRPIFGGDADRFFHCLGAKHTRFREAHRAPPFAPLRTRSCFSFSRSAASTFSGVMGSVLRRTPTAS